MKNIILIALLISLPAALLFSQEDVLRPEGKPGGYGEAVYDDYEFSGSPFSIGFEVGGNYNMFSQNLSWDPPLTDPIIESTEDGSGLSPYIGVFADIPINYMFGVHLKLQYNSIFYSNSGTGLIDGYDNNTGTYNEIAAELEWDNSFAYFNIEPSLRINLNKGFFALIGLSLQVPVSEVTQNTTATILEEGYTFQATGTEVNTVETSSDILNTRMGLNLSVGYKHHLSNSMYLVPQLHFQFMPSKVTDDQVDGEDTTKQFTEGISTFNATDRQMHHLRFSLALWFDL